MPRRPSRSVPTLVLPSWQGSGPGHWQTWLEEQLHAAGRRTLRPDFADLDHPDPADWLRALRAALAGLPSDTFDVVAHSLGAVLWLHHVAGEQVAYTALAEVQVATGRRNAVLFERAPGEPQSWTMPTAAAVLLIWKPFGPLFN